MLIDISRHPFLIPLDSPNIRYILVIKIKNGYRTSPALLWASHKPARSLHYIKIILSVFTYLCSCYDIRISSIDVSVRVMPHGVLMDPDIHRRSVEEIMNTTTNGFPNPRLVRDCKVTDTIIIERERYLLVSYHANGIPPLPGVVSASHGYQS